MEIPWLGGRILVNFYWENCFDFCPGFAQFCFNLLCHIFVRELPEQTHYTRVWLPPMPPSPHLAFKFSQSQQISRLRKPLHTYLERSGRKLCMWTIVRLGRPQRNRTDSLRKKYGMCIFLHKNLWNFKMQLLLDKCNRRLDIYAMAVMFGFQEFMCEVADFCEVRRFVCEGRRFLWVSQFMCEVRS